MRAALTVITFLLSVVAAHGQGLSQGVQAEKSAYAIGDKITFQYVVRNNTNRPLVYNFSSAKQHDIWVSRGGLEVYRLSANKAYAQMFTSLTLQPGEAKTYCTEWNQKDRSGKQVGPGIYTVYAQLTPTGPNPPPVTSKQVQIGIRGAVLVPVTIKEAITRYNDLSGRKVVINAKFTGYSPNPNNGNTQAGPPVTRSDWAISDDTGSMYVVGNTTLDPTKDTGTKITVIGKLSKTAKDQVYMILDSITVDNKTCLISGT